MLPNLEVIIGIENHVELKTKTKMFSNSPVGFGAAPNTLVDPTALGYPGALPTINREGVRLAILASQALHLTIDPLLRFDRKNYFYPDLVKGFQITQQFHPIGRDGWLEIETNSGQHKKIAIERLHIEEDTAKQMHEGKWSYLDFNRSGVGLIEVVTKPVMHTADEAVAYVEKLREILLFLGVSDVKMSEGSLRCDVNISLRPFGASTYGKRVEIKNLNSFMNVRKAINYEIERQTQRLLEGKKIAQETRRFDEKSQKTVAMRSKVDAIDYRYFPEPNLMPVLLDQEWISDVISKAPQTADQKRHHYVTHYQLRPKDVNSLLADLELTKFFEAMLKETPHVAKGLSFLLTELMAQLHKRQLLINQASIEPKQVAILINYLQEGKISSAQSKAILEHLFHASKPSVDSIIESHNLKLIDNPKLIKTLLAPIFSQNKALIVAQQDRPERIVKTIMGQLMAQTKGNVNPKLATSLIIKELESAKNRF